MTSTTAPLEPAPKQPASRLAPESSDVAFTIANLRSGQVIELALSRWIDESEWPPVQRRLETLINVRQPAELRLDLDDVARLGRFPDGLRILREALAQFGSSLTVAIDLGVETGTVHDQ